jgi:hypothetical protein
MKTLLKTVVGSKLYGIDGPDSDTDYKGFGIPGIEEVLGFNCCEQIESSNGLLGKHKEECVIYNLKKFLKLCASGNPTVLEIAFTPRRFHAEFTVLGDQVTKFVRENMLHKKMYNAYRGYFNSQLHKLKNKVYDEKSVRQDLIAKYGYDVKFAAHAKRLGIQCGELLRFGKEFSPVLSPTCQLIVRRIRNGEVSYDEVIETLENELIYMETDYNRCGLPENLNMKLVEDFFVDIQIHHYGVSF